jgi:hypothetical protein
MNAASRNDDGEVNIRESEVEDVLAQYPRLAKRILGRSEDIFLLTRQKPLRSGRLDLMYACANELLLVELKVEEFRAKFLSQVLCYRDDLVVLQKQAKFVRGDIRPYVLCLGFDRSAATLAEDRGVALRAFDPRELLIEFYKNAPLDTKYLSTFPTDKGVWRVGLTCESLSLVASCRNASAIAEARACSVKTAGNQLRLLEELGLISSDGNQVALSPLGKEFLQNNDEQLPPDALSTAQAELLRKFILERPFFSGVTVGILTLVGCVFELSKNTYPVPRPLLARHFIGAAGLHFRWSREKAINKGVRMYSNYAAELGLVGKIGEGYFVTPSGLKFVLLLNLHKSLRFIENIEKIA